MLTITVKLRLRDKHASELNRQSRAVNYVWNYANETSQKAWRDHRRWLSNYELQRLTSGSSVGLNIRARTINRVCQEFAKARDARKRPGLRWRGRKSLGWVPFNTGDIHFDGRAFKFHGVLYETMHLSPRLEAGIRIGAGSFNCDTRGRWYINMPVKVAFEGSGDNKPAIGIDLGLNTLATFSDGKQVANGRFYRDSEAVIANLQRRRKTRRMAAVARKIANRRKDALHKASLSIAKEYGLIFVGNASPSKLARTIMAKSMHDAGWATLKSMISYKALMHGGKMIEVNEAYTSQTCSCCGSLPPGRPKGIAGLSKRTFDCSDCGSVMDRDVNAAINIRRIGLDTLAGGAAQMRSNHVFRGERVIAPTPTEF